MTVEQQIALLDILIREAEARARTRRHGRPAKCLATVLRETGLRLAVAEPASREPRP
jgi:hypothetical protein